MGSFTLTIFLFLVSSFLSATTIIYVDYSSISNIKKIISLVEGIVKVQANEEIVIFISNDKFPIITNGNDAKGQLKAMFKASPSKPDFYWEIDTISDIINNNVKLSLKLENRRVLNEDLNLYFILDGHQSITYNQTKYFVNKLLLVNRLIHNHKVVDKTSITIYYNEEDLFLNKNELTHKNNTLGYDIIFF